MKFPFKKYIVAGLAVIAFTACEEQLEILPEQDLSTELAFFDEASATGSLMGTYSLTQDLDVFGGMQHIIADFQSDNVDFIGSFPTLQEIRNFAQASTNGSIQVIWRDTYIAILAANAVIANVPNVEDEGFTADERAQYIAEAKFIRAICYYYLLNLFAQPVNIAGDAGEGIPLVLDPYIGEVEFPERATIGAVHQQILTDLTEAIDDLPTVYDGGEEDKGRATPNACYGFIARVHFLREEWSEAITAIGNITGAGLAADYSFFGTVTSPEVIYGNLNSAIDNGATGSGSWANWYNPAELNARGDCPFSNDLLATFDQANDLRFGLTQVGANGRTYTTKFPDPVLNSADVILLRWSELVLSHAEALVQRDGLAAAASAIALVNPIRTRAGLTPYTVLDFGSDADLIDAIRLERRLELCFEGDRRMDILRSGGNLRPNNGAMSAAGADFTILPIPQRERDINPNLTQNNGY